MEAPATLRKRDIWLTSDTHFFHENIIMYCGRPFSGAEEMNEVLTDNWNKVVKPGDIVYHLGDVLMGPGGYEGFPSFINRLNGSKRLVVGNHDDIPWLSKGGWFKKVVMWRVFPEYNLLLTHVPIHESSIHERIVVNGGVNVHGHVHNNPSPDGPYRCVCVEQTGYTPVHIEEVINNKNT
jgi:calcineurin-like phosphoesterase family protein